jgi:hypothetical protein
LELLFQKESKVEILIDDFINALCFIMNIKYKGNQWLIAICFESCKTSRTKPTAILK